MGRWGAILGIYALMSLVSGALAFWLTGSLFTHPAPWLELGPIARHAYSALIGLLMGLAIGASSRRLVRTRRWARHLHEELRPWAQSIAPPLIPWVALLSGLGEELLFRSLVLPLIGLLPQALLFGLAHQLPGRARFTWVVWAIVMGVLLGVLFEATGSLIGPVLAHATVNAMGLRFMLHHDSTTTARPLGGVLGQRT